MWALQPVTVMACAILALAMATYHRELGFTEGDIIMCSLLVIPMTAVTFGWLCWKNSFAVGIIVIALLVIFGPNFLFYAKYLHGATELLQAILAPIGDFIVYMIGEHGGDLSYWTTSGIPTQ